MADSLHEFVVAPVVFLVVFPVVHPAAHFAEHPAVFPVEHPAVVVVVYPSVAPVAVPVVAPVFLAVAAASVVPPVVFAPVIPSSFFCKVYFCCGSVFSFSFLQGNESSNPTR